MAIIALFVFNCAIGQDQAKYDSLVNVAWNFYQAKDFKSSANNYSAAFVALGHKGQSTDRYNAACSWTLIGNADSAFFQLNNISTKQHYSNFKHISTDTNLARLHNDSRWEQLMTVVKSNKEKEEANFDKPLVALLDSIYIEDQKYRLEIDGIVAKYGRQSPEMKAHWKIINAIDSTNTIVIRKILDERGWLGPSVIGQQGNTTLFLVIQHAKHEVQEKYLPMMRDAVSKGNAKASSLALLEDRVAAESGKSQIYGSQIGQDSAGNYIVKPLFDPVNVNKRRKEVGLRPLEQYIKTWNMTWDVEAYLKSLPSLKARFMIKD